MYELIRFTLEKIINGISWAIDHHKFGKDTKIGSELLDLFERMQDIYLIGTRIVDALERMAGDGSPSEAQSAGNDNLEQLLQQQLTNIERLQGSIERVRRVISTVDSDLFVALRPLLDRKSGFLTRLLQEGQLSQRSSTFVFYLDYATVEDLYGKGFGGSSRRQLSDRVNELRLAEIRDIAHLTPTDKDRLALLIRDRQPRKEIEQIRELSKHFHDKLDASFRLKSIRQHG